MTVFNKYLGIDTVESSDGRIIKCKYMLHDIFDINTPIFFQLHFIFITFTRERVYTHGYLLNNAYLHLFDYLLKVKSTKSAIKVSTLTDINAEVFNGYQLYLKKNGLVALHASALKNALSSVAETTGQIPFILLPIVDLPERGKTEPLPPETFKSLTDALSSHIDSLHEKLEFRKKVEEAQPYILESVQQEFISQYTRQNIFRWYQHKLSTGSKRASDSSAISNLLKKSDDSTLLALVSEKNVLQQFQTLYEAEGTAHLLENPTNPFENAIRNWEPDDARVLKTLLTSGYPMDISIEEHQTKYLASKCMTLQGCDSITKLFLHRYIPCNQYININYRTPQWDELLGMYFPTMVDMAAIVIFIMVQSGWNKETVLAIDPNNFEDIFNGMINDSYSVVFSEKQRSQSAKQPYFTPKRFSALSSTEDKYSIHNLILLAQELSAPLKSYAFDFINLDKDVSTLNPMFLCIRYWADWKSKGGRHTSASNIKAFVVGVKHFLRKFPVFENGERITTPGDFTLRLRPTWVKYNRKNNPLSILALQQGHEDANTTDVYYDSSGAAMQERRELLRSELEAVIGLLRRREFSGIMGKAATKLSNEEFKLFTIPGSRSSMWGCSNQLQPDWPGHQRIVSKGEKCYEIGKCIFCSRIRIFEDSLPYLIERLQQISDRISDQEEDLITADSDEVKIIQFILDGWNDDEAVRRAGREQQRLSPLLPSDISSLKLIFSEQDKS